MKRNKTKDGGYSMYSDYGNPTGNIENFNPVIDSLLRPRETFLHIKNTNKDLYFWQLVYCLGLITILNHIDEYGVPISLGILGLIFVLAPLAGYIELHISAFLLEFVGRKFNGQGSVDDLRIAVLWSRVPYMAILPGVFFINLVNYSKFYRFQSTVHSSAILEALLVICALLAFVANIWCFFNLLRMVSEAQQFSKWIAFITYIIPGLVLFAIGMGFVLLASIAVLH